MSAAATDATAGTGVATSPSPARLRVVFMGTPAYALGSLDALAASPSVEVALVVTRPDAVSRRGSRLVPSEVKARALELGLPVLETKTLRDPAVQERLRAELPDVVCVTAFGAIIPDEVLAIPRLGSLNVHASLLPRWRGAAPMQRALLAGDERLGYSVMRVDHGLDTGPWCRQGSVEVAGRTYAELSPELSRLGGEALAEVLEAWARGEAPRWVEQDEARATYAAKLDKAELALSPELAAAQNARRVQASSDECPARCVVAGRALRVLSAQVATAQAGVARGEVAVTRGRVLLGCADGALELTTVRPDGKRAMDAASFAAGLHGADLAWSAL